MITGTSPNQVFSITFQADYKNSSTSYFYTLSRSMLRVKRETNIQVSVILMTISGGGVTHNVNYYTDPDGVVEVPLRNFVNEFYNLGATQFAITLNFHNLDGTSADGSVIIFGEPLKGISYFDVYAPKEKDSRVIVTSVLHNTIMPPNVMFNPDNGKGIKVESNVHTFDNSLVWESLVSGVATTLTPSGDRSNIISIGQTADTLKCSKTGYEQRWKLEKFSACSNFIVCRWTSITGAVRQHYFPIVSFIDGVDGELSILEAGNGYDIRKNIYKGVRCSIQGLTRYGYWYYMDMVQASDLHAVILPTYSIWETEISSMETAVYCEAGTMETPSGNGFYNFDFVLRLKHYDTF